MYCESFLLVNFMVGIAQELQDDGMPQYAWIIPKEVVDLISIIENDMLEKIINDMKKRDSK